MRILIALHTFVWLYYFNLLPTLSEAWQKKDGTFAKAIANSLHLVAWITMFSGVLWVLVAPLVITVVYGPAFAPAGTALQWLAGVGVAAGLSGHYRFGLIAAGRQNVEMIIGAVAAVGAVIVIPVGYRASGPSGVAMGLLATELLVWMLAWWWSQANLALNGHLRYLIRPLAITVLATMLLWMIPFAPASLRVAAATALFAAAAFSLDAGLRNRCSEAIGLGRPWLRRHLVKRVEVA